MLTLAAFLALAFQPGASPDPVEELPTGPPPSIQIVRLDERGNLVTQVTVPVTVTVEKAVTRIVDGRQVVEKVAVTETRYRAQEVTRSGRGLIVTDLAGKKLDPKEAARLLAKPTLVAVTSDGKPLPSGYQRLFVKGTLVLTLPGVSEVPPIAPPAPPLPPPIPAPRRG